MPSSASAAAFPDDPEHRLEPELVRAWKRVPEGFLFTIREGVKFHEGQTLEPSDVVFSINRALTPKSQFKSSCAGITGAELAGPREVLVKTATGSPVILNQLVDLKLMNEA